MSIGFKAHNTINIIGFNTPEWFMADVGAILAGGIAGMYYLTLQCIYFIIYSLYPLSSPLFNVSLLFSYFQCISNSSLISLISSLRCISLLLSSLLYISNFSLHFSLFYVSPFVCQLVSTPRTRPMLASTSPITVTAWWLSVKTGRKCVYTISTLT